MLRALSAKHALNDAQISELHVGVESGMLSTADLYGALSKASAMPKLLERLRQAQPKLLGLDGEAQATPEAPGAHEQLN